MLIETLMVSLTVTGLLIYIYTQFVSINNNYENIYQYNTTNELYIASYIRDDLIKNGKDSTFNRAKTTPVLIYQNGTSKTNDYYNDTAFINGIIGPLKIKNVILTYKDASAIKNLVKNSDRYDVSMKKFVSLMKNSTEEYRLIIEFEDYKAATILFDRGESNG